MIADVPAILRALLAQPRGKKSKTTQAELAEDIGGGTAQSLISRWLNGSAPDLENYERILRLARERHVIQDMRSEDVSASMDRAPAIKVKVKGYVGAGAAAHFYALSDEEYEEVDPPAGATDKTVAVEIRGASFGPLLKSWLVFYDDVRSPVTEDLIGEVCVVGLADDRILIKQIARGRSGGYDLLSNSDEEPIRGAIIEWAAKVTDMRPR